MSTEQEQNPAIEPKAKAGRKKKVVTQIEAASSPNDELTELSSIDYANLNGEAFTEYQEVLNSLFDNDKYDFEMWLATSEFKFKLDENNGDKVKYLNGIKLNGAKPIQVTRLTVRSAKELNKYVSPVVGERTTSKYYLLKKPTI